MISICIPIYNQQVTKLVQTLARQMSLLNLGIEIIVVDDGSENVFDNENCLKEHTYIELPENVGRSKIRNLFVQYANYDVLLFLDGDVEMVCDNFLKKYIEVVKNNSFDVICGGLVYTDVIPEKTHQLRWKYGVEKECRSVEERMENPYTSFMTSNFVIKKETLISFPFDEKITDYGHEDTLLGFDLKKAQKKIIHIQNPVLHADHESNGDFVSKTEVAVQNLLHILRTQNHSKEFTESIKLLKLAERVKSIKMEYMVLFLFKLLKGFLKKGLATGNITSLNCFNFYKLGVFFEYKKKRIKSTV